MAQIACHSQCSWWINSSNIIYGACVGNVWRKNDTVYIQPTGCYVQYSKSGSDSRSQANRTKTYYVSVAATGAWISSGTATIPSGSWSGWTIYPQGMGTGSVNVGNTDTTINVNHSWAGDGPYGCCDIMCNSVIITGKSATWNTVTIKAKLLWSRKGNTSDYLEVAIHPTSNTDYGGTYRFKTVANSPANGTEYSGTLDNTSATGVGGSMAAIKGNTTYKVGAWNNSMDDGKATWRFDGSTITTPPSPATIHNGWPAETGGGYEKECDGTALRACITNNVDDNNGNLYAWFKIHDDTSGTDVYTTSTGISTVTHAVTLNCGTMPAYTSVTAGHKYTITGWFTGSSTDSSTNKTANVSFSYTVPESSKCYVGDSSNKAKRITKMYWGDSSNKAKKIVHAYVGDSSNKAKKLF